MLASFAANGIYCVIGQLLRANFIEDNQFDLLGLKVF
jgi:hypothetical protein